MNFLSLFLLILALSLVLSGFRMYRYIISVKNTHRNELFGLISDWYRQINENNDKARISLAEKAVEAMFEKKVNKTALLHFDERFISRFLKEKLSVDCSNDLKKTFEDISRTGLKKSRQSLKILSMAFGHEFTLENYSFYNYWLIMKGNRVLFAEKKKDSEGRSYGKEDIDEPFAVLEFYFNELKNKGKK